MLVTTAKDKLSISGFPFSHFLCFLLSNNLKLKEKKRKKRKEKKRKEKLHHKIMFLSNNDLKFEKTKGKKKALSTFHYMTNYQMNP